MSESESESKSKSESKRQDAPSAVAAGRFCRA